MSDTPQDGVGTNVWKDFGINVGNISNIKALLTQSGFALPDLRKVQVSEVEVAVPEPWINATLLNDWSNYGSPNPTMAYMKHPDGTVEVRGTIEGASHGAGLGTVAFTLPSQFKPDADRIFPIASATGYGSVQTGTNGDVTPWTGSTTWMYLNFRFKAYDSRPQVLSCFPLFIKTKLKESPAGVFIISTSFAETKRSPLIVPGATPHHCDWSFISKPDGHYIRINNITGLPYSQKTKVRFLIVGV